eukprot:141594-Rhodomonas_salina.1
MHANAESHSRKRIPAAKYTESVLSLCDARAYGERMVLSADALSDSDMACVVQTAYQHIWRTGEKTQRVRTTGRCPGYPLCYAMSDAVQCPVWTFAILCCERDTLRRPVLTWAEPRRVPHAMSGTEMDISQTALMA